MRQVRAWRRSWFGAAVSSRRASRRKGRNRGRSPVAACRRSRNKGSVGTLRRLLGGIGQLHRPRPLLAGVDLEESGSVITAGKTVFRAANGEYLVGGAHESLPRPFAPAVIVDRIDVIKASSELALEQDLATAVGDVPPAFGRPALTVLVADSYADAARCVVTQTKIGAGAPRKGGQHDDGRARQHAPRGDLSDDPPVQRSQDR